MECSPTHFSPLAKKEKKERNSTPKKSHETTDTFSPQPNIVQRIKYVLAIDQSRPRPGQAKNVSQPNENTTVFNFPNGEILVVNTAKSNM